MLVKADHAYAPGTVILGHASRILRVSRYPAEFGRAVTVGGR